MGGENIKEFVNLEDAILEFLGLLLLLGGRRALGRYGIRAIIIRGDDYYDHCANSSPLHKPCGVVVNSGKRTPDVAEYRSFSL